MWLEKYFTTKDPAVKSEERGYDLAESLLQQDDDDDGDEVEGVERHGPGSPSTARQCPFTLSTMIIAISFLVLAILGIVIHLHKSETARCVKPARRREWRQLGDDEKEDYISAVQCLHELPSRVTGKGAVSDDFPWVHSLTATSTHFAAPFLPWHRYFLYIYEKTLRDSCGYLGYLPYWDWTLDWEDPSKSPIWDVKTGFGGDGTSSGAGHSVTVGDLGECIAEGPFFGYQVYWKNNITAPHCLSRGFGRCFPNGTAPVVAEAVSPDAISRAISKKRYIQFSTQLQIGPHNVLHTNVCGDLAFRSAPNDPVFFLHHAQLDHLWWIWQQQDAKRGMEYNGPKEGKSAIAGTLDDMISLMGLAPDIPVRDMMMTESDTLCYIYE